MTIRKESPNPRLPLRGGLHLSKTSPGRIAVLRHRCLSLSSTAFAQREDYP